MNYYFNTESAFRLAIIIFVIRIITVLIVLGLVYYFLILPKIRLKHQLNNQKQETLLTPNIYSHVTVFSRTMRTIKAGLDTRTLPFISFEFEDGARKDFECDLSLYANTREGDKGSLTYKEKDECRIIIAFQREL